MSPESKVCTQCQCKKDLEDFYPNKLGKYGRNSFCKECDLNRNHAYYAVNRQARREYSRAYRVANKERSNEYSLAYNAAHRVYLREYQRAYAASHLEQGRMYTHNRKATKRGVNTGTVTAKWWGEQLEYFQGRCAYCLIKIDKLEMEHMKPLSRGGLHDISNVVPACHSCNASKYTTDLIGWVGRSLRRTE